MAETTTQAALPPEIAARLTEYWHLGYVEGGCDADPEATDEDRADVMRRRKAARAALEAEIATLAQDAALGKALRETVETGDSAGGRLYIEWGGDQPPGVARENWATLRDDNDSCYALARLLAAAARTPEEADHA